MLLTTLKTKTSEKHCGKGANAGNHYFLLFKQWMLSTLFNSYPHKPNLNDPYIEAFWKHCGNQHFLLFRQYSLLFPKQISIFQPNWNCCPQMLLIWTSLKICHLVKLKQISIFQSHLFCLQKILSDLDWYQILSFGNELIHRAPNNPQKNY